MVVGFGTMGAGIAQVCALGGYDVDIYEPDEAMKRKGLASVEWSLGKMAEKQQLSEDKAAILARMTLLDQIESVKDTDLVIEAVYEDKKVKQDLFQQLEKVVSKDTILATNTSSLSVTEIASAVSIPERFVGIHFFNPVLRMKLVEIVKGVMTSDATVAAAKEMVSSLGKEVVVVNKDSAGFIVNRINGMALLEALKMAEKGVASIEDIDKAMRFGLGSPMGPFELMDMIGLDIVLKAREGIYNETKDPTHFPPVLLRRMVQAGLLGRKTKRGFYNYETS